MDHKNKDALESALRLMSAVYGRPYTNLMLTGFTIGIGGTLSESEIEEGAAAWLKVRSRMPSPIEFVKMASPDAPQYGEGF